MKSTGICRWLFLLISLSTWTTLTSSKEMRVVCYYTNWSVYRPGAAKFSPQNINPYLCTHLVYAFGGFTKENTLKPFDKYQDIEKGGYAKFTGLKTYNKNLKTMLAIGGWNEGSSRFSPMVANAERRKELVKNAIKFLRQNHFDGLDLDWEYPSFRDGGKTRDRDNYAQLVQELREEFDRESEKTGRPRLLLTMAVPAGIEYINKGYDIPKLTKYLDWMNILSYDYHSAFEPAVNHHAPLYSLEEDSEYNYDAELNIDFTIKHYLKLGADPDKLILGIPTYGRSYTLYNPEAFEIGSPADGPGEMGDATRENGYLAYYEICDYVKNQGWQEEQPDSNAMGPYAYKENQWVGYDDENIVRKKAEYVAENELGGIMFWAIDNDDFRGNCHGRPYPLIESAKEALMEAYGLTDANLISPPSKPIKPKNRTRPKPTSKPRVSDEEPKSPKITNRRRSRPKSKVKVKETEELPSPVRRLKPRRKDSRKTTPATEASTYSSLKVTTPSYTTPAPPSTPDLDGAFKCEDEGFFPHPKDCKKYFWCLSGAGDSGIVAHQFTCPAGLYFNKAADSCDYTQNVLCNKKIPKAITSAPPKSSTTSTTAAIVSTTRAPKVTAATSRTTFRQSTTTEASDDDYEYEDEEEETLPASEEDPKVIKELIDLIKKAGGIEELEKQLSRSGSTSSGQDTTTQSAISKTLYERVLSKAKTTLNAKKNAVPSLRNSRGPQNDGLPKSDEKTSRGKTERGKLQYTSISRNRSTTPKPEEDVEDEDVEEEEASDVKDRGAKPRRLFNKKSQPEYVTIIRPRISTTTEAIDNASGLNRNKILGEVSEDEEEYDDEEDDDDDEAVEEADAPKKTFTPQYVNIRRQRPSTTEETSTSKYKEIRRGSTTEATSEANDKNEDSKYQTIRRGSTTSPPTTIASSEIITSKNSPLRRGLTTTSTTPPTVSDESTSKYKNFRRGTTTEKPNQADGSSTKYIQLRRGTTTSTTTATTSTSGTTESTTTFRSTSTTPNSATPTDEENYVTPSFQSSTIGTISIASEQVGSTVSARPTESSLGSSGVSRTSTTESSSLQESTTNANINLVDGAVTTTHATTTIKEASSPGIDNITTKSANEDTTTMESKESSVSSSESVPVDVSTTTQRHRTRPVTSNGRSTTVKPPTESTTASKVSQSKFKLRLRQKTAELPPKDVDNKTISTTENPTERNTIKYKGRGSVRATNRPNVAANKEEDEEDATSKIKSRRRFTTTERPLDERTYRPSELDDLSSLTAVDFEKLKEVSTDQAHKRRRPTPPPTTTAPSTTTEEEEVDVSLKTSPRTLPLARKRIDPSTFGKSRRVIPPANDDVNSVELDASATTKRGRGFGVRSTRQPSTTTESSEVSASTESSPGTVNITPRSRRVVRRFRTTTTRSNKIDDTSNKTSSDKPPFRRGKIFAAQNRNQTALKESTVETKSVRPNNNLQRLFNKKPARLPFGLQKNKIDEETDESLEDTSTEEGENIKLSESNIRENSDVNSFDTSGKQRRKVVKLIKPKSDNLHDKINPHDKIRETGKIITESGKSGSNKGIENETTTKVQVTTTDIVKETTTATTKATEKTIKSNVEKVTEPQSLTTLPAETTTFTENPTIPPTTTDGRGKIKPIEPNNILRTRKVIKKLKPKGVGSTTNFDKVTGRRRKIIRRRPVNSTATEESKDSVQITTEIGKLNTTQTTTSRLRTRPTTTPTSELKTTTAKEPETEVSRRVFRPSLTRRARPTARPLGRTNITSLKSLKPSESSTETLKKQVFRPKTNLQRNKLRPIPRRGPTRYTTKATTSVNTPSVTIIPYNTDTTPLAFNTRIHHYDTTTQALNGNLLRRRQPQRTRSETTTGLAETTAETIPATEATTTTESTSEMSTEFTVEREEKDDSGKVKIVKSSTSIYNLYKPISDESEFDEEESQKNATRNKDPKNDRNRNYVSVFRQSTTSNTFDNFDTEFDMETPPHLKEEEDEDEGFGDDEYETDHFREIQEPEGDEVDRLMADTSTEFKSEILGDTTYYPYDDFRHYESLAESSSVSNRISKPDKAMQVELTTPSKTSSTSPRPRYKTFSKTSNKTILKETIKMISSFNETDPDGKLAEVVVNRFKYRTLERTTAIPILKDEEEDSSELSGESFEETTRAVDLTTLLNMDDSSESIESGEEDTGLSTDTTTENYSEEFTLLNSSLEPDFTTHLSVGDKENEIFDVSTNSNEARTEKPSLTTIAHTTNLQTDNILNQITSTTGSSVSQQNSTLSPSTTENPQEITTSLNPLDIETDLTETTDQETSTTPIPKPTTEYHRRSTLRSIESRPKFTPMKRKNTFSNLSTTEATKAFNRFRTRYRSTTESASISEKPTRSSPLNRYLYRTSSTTSTTSTTERASLKGESDSSSDNEDTTENDAPTTEYVTEDDLSVTKQSPTTTAIPIDRYVYSHSTTQVAQETVNDEDVDNEKNSGTTEIPEDSDEEIIEEQKEAEPVKKPVRPSTNFRQRLSTARPRTVNRPIKNIRRPNSPIRSNTPHFGRSTTPRVINKPNFAKTTESTKPNEDLSGIDTLAVKNRNKNLFSKKRKLNRPVSTSSTTIATELTELPDTTVLEETSTLSDIINEVTEDRATSAAPVTEAVTKPSAVETTESLTTLHHIFAAVDGDQKNNNTETTTESLSFVTTTTGKIEKLVEVNRIRQVKTKEAKVKNHHVVGEQSTANVAPVIDKIGQVNRVTVIKVVNGNETTSNDVDYNDNELKNTSSKSPIYVPTEEKSDPLKGIPAKVEEIPAAEAMGKVNLTNITVTISSIPELLHTHRENRKFEAPNKQNRLEIEEKAEIVDGISHVNVFTPRPVFSTEASTIALEGLFQTDSPQTIQTHNKFLNNDEILETENSRFVNVRVLHTDKKGELSKTKEYPKNLPVNIFRHEVTLKAEVVEVAPKTNPEPIKIVPIRVEMSKRVADSLPVYRVGPQN